MSDNPNFVHPCLTRRDGTVTHIFTGDRRLCLCSKEEKPGIILQVESRQRHGPDMLLGLPIVEEE